MIARGGMIERKATGGADLSTMSGDATATAGGVLSLAYHYKKGVQTAISGDTKTITAAGIAGKFIVRTGTTVATTDKVDTATNILAALTGNITVNTVVEFFVWNYSSYNITILYPDDNSVLWDANPVLAPNAFAHFVGYISNIVTPTILGEWWDVTPSNVAATSVMVGAGSGTIGFAALAVANAGELIIGQGDGTLKVFIMSGEASMLATGAVTVATTHSGSAHHTRSHSIVGTSDHTSTATSGKMLKADANGLPIDATNTDADVADAVTKKIDYNPWDIDINPLLPAAQTVWSALSVNANAINNAIKASGGSQNDFIQWKIFIPAGTWTVYVIHQTGTVYGIISVQIDDVEKGTIDTYTDPGVWNVVGSVAGIVIATSATYTLKFKMATKNVASGGYYGVIMQVKLLRSS